MLDDLLPPSQIQLIFEHDGYPNKMTVKSTLIAMPLLFLQLALNAQSMSLVKISENSKMKSVQCPHHQLWEIEVKTMKLSIEQFSDSSLVQDQNLLLASYVEKMRTFNVAVETEQYSHKMISGDGWRGILLCASSSEKVVKKAFKKLQKQLHK
jgi:hypothetical protein